MRLPTRILWISAALLIYGLLSPRAWAQKISTESPFLPRGGSSINGPTENTPVELRGIMKTEGNPSFGLYDPVNKKGGWVKLNEGSKDGFPATVRNYDAANNAITVEYQGRVLNLTMKEAKIENAPMMAQVQPLPTHPPMPGQPPAAAPAPTPTVDNQKQMEAVAAEVARRRQQRQAALSQQPTLQAQPQQQAAPVQGQR